MPALSPSGRRQRYAMISGINVTPLVDVVLVLLVILMVASTYIVSQSMKVELPRATTSDGRSESPAVVLVQRDGTLRLNQQIVAESELERRLVALLEEQPDVPVVISADRLVPHGRVVQFVDMARAAGAKRFAITVQKSE
jgi:biopolymer transport protein ExbD